MKRLILYGIPALACLLLSLSPAASAVCRSDYYCAYDEEKAVVIKNGADISGRVFTKTYDPEPDEIVVLAGDRAFVLRTKGLFMQKLGAPSVYEAAVNGIDDTAKPVVIDLAVGSGIAGTVLEETAGGGYAFSVGEDRYEVRLKRPIERDPDKFVYLKGLLTSKTERVGSKSEGPEYYLETEYGRELHVVKNANLWEEDPALREMVDTEVWMSGYPTDGGLIYSEVSPNLR